MAIKKPTYKQIINRTRADVSSALPELDPTITNSFIRTFTDSLASRSYDIVKLLEQVEKNLVPETADGEYLEIWANYEGIVRHPALISSGPIVITGTGTIPIDTELTSADGNIYTTNIELTLSAPTIEINYIVRFSTVVIVETVSNHNFASNMYIDITGADQSEYNGNHKITVTKADQFTYIIDTTPATPATTSSTLDASYDGGIVNISSDEAGLSLNMEAGGKVTLSSPIAGVDSEAYVTFDEISGGVDSETNVSLLTRIKQSRSSPVANFNIGAIEKIVLAEQISTRVLVKPITPNVGDVTILFVNDNEDNIIPTATDVNTIKTAILEIKPANTSDDSVVVKAPTPITTDYTFTNINPDTSTMKTAIENNLKAFYESGVEFETNITEDKYRSAIIDTIDQDTGDQLLSFTLSTPSGDITVTTDEIGVIGTINI